MIDVETYLTYIVRGLVFYPDEVEVRQSVDEKGILLELTVAPSDVGRIIGKAGITAQAIRQLLRALGVRNEARYSLKVLDDRKNNFGEA